LDLKLVKRLSSEDLKHQR